MDKLDRIIDEYERAGPRWEKDTLLGRLQSARNDPKAVKKWGKQSLGEAEHMAYSMQQVRANPLWSVGLLGMVPGWDAYKALGFGERDDTTIEPGLGSMGAGYRGIWKGLFSE